MIKKIPTSPAKVIFLLLLIMLGAQAFTGQQGILMWRQYAIESDALARQKQELALKKTQLENQIKLLKSQAPNQDFIEEQALQKLDMVAAQDKIIKLPN